MTESVPTDLLDEINDPVGMGTFNRLRGHWRTLDSGGRELFNRQLLDHLSPKACFVPVQNSPDPVRGHVLAAPIANAIDLGLQYRRTSTGSYVLERTTVAIGGIAVTTAKALRACRWGVRLLGFIENPDAPIRQILDKLLPRGSLDVSALRAVDVPVTRVNVFLAGVLDEGEEYFGTKGFHLDENQYLDLLGSVGDLEVTPKTFLIVGGGVPRGAPENFFPRLIQEAQTKGIRVFFDFIKYLSPVEAEAILDAKPYAVKMNSDEFMKFGKGITLGSAEISNFEPAEMMEAARRFAMEKTLNMFLLSLGALGAIVATKDGEAWYAEAPSISAVSTTGAGNSMMAAMIASITAEKSLDYSLQLSVACATQTCLKPGTQVASLDEAHEAMGDFTIPIRPFQGT